MRGLFLFVTAPLWFPLLCTAASASLVLGLAMVTGGAILRSGQKPARDDWDLA